MDQFAVVARERDVPLLEDLLECAELAGGQFVAEAARTAVREERDRVVAQAEGTCGAAGAVAPVDRDHLALAEVVSAALAAELVDLVPEIAEGVGVEQLVEAEAECVGGVVVAAVIAVLAGRGPVRGDAQRVADVGACAQRNGLDPELAADLATLAEGTLNATGSRGESDADGFDEGLAHGKRPRSTFCVERFKSRNHAELIATNACAALGRWPGQGAVARA